MFDLNAIFVFNVTVGRFQSGYWGLLIIFVTRNYLISIKCYWQIGIENARINFFVADDFCDENCFVHPNDFAVKGQSSFCGTNDVSKPSRCPASEPTSKKLSINKSISDDRSKDN